MDILHMGLFLISIVGISGNVFELQEWTPEKISEIPAPPTCTTSHALKNVTHSEVTLWTFDSKRTPNHAVVYWDETITTECYTNFLGITSQSYVKTVAHLPDRREREFLIASTGSLSDYETLDFENSPMFECSWMKTIQKTSVRHWARREKITWLSDGSILGYHAYVERDRYNGEYVSNTKRMTLEMAYLEKCPLSKVSTDGGIINQHLDDIRITIPKLNLQFDLNPLILVPVCTGAHKVYLTPSGHLVSWGKSNESKSFHLENQDMITHLNSIYESSRIAYSINHLASLVESDLIDIEIAICRDRAQIWAIAMMSDNPNAMAVYITGNPYSRGIYKKSELKVQSTEKVTKRCEFPDVKKVYRNCILMNCSLTSTWIEPISGVIQPSGSLCRFNSHLIPVSNILFLDYQTGKKVPIPGIRLSTFQEVRELEVFEDPTFIVRDEDSPSHIPSPFSKHQWNMNLSSLIEWLSSFAFWMELVITLVILYFLTLVVPPIINLLKTMCCRVHNKSDPESHKFFSA